MTSSQVSRLLCGRLSALGIPKRVKTPILDTIKKWISCSGPEWTVARLKDLKIDLIRSWSGQEPISKGIKYRNGTPTGPFRPLWSWTSPRGRFKAVQVLQAYTALVSREVTPRQRAKFELSVTRGPAKIDTSADPFVVHLQESVGQLIPNWITTWGGHHVPNFDDYPWSNERRQPNVHGKTLCEIDDKVSPYHPLHDLVLSNIFIDLYRDHEVLRNAVPPSLRKQFDEDADFGYQSPVYEHFRRKFTFVDNVGKISFIQEPGYKLRAVANPLRIYQVALTPMQKAVDRVLRFHTPGCYVHDQLLGIDKVQEQLRNNVRVHSVDLSDATNNFPLSLQLHVLNWAHYPFKEEISLFEKVSRSPWIYKDSSGKKSSLTWTVGQPLGLAPSFGCFTLAHAMVLSTLQKEISGSYPGKRGLEPLFAIVGDDVAIFNDSLAESYRDFLKDWDIPISLNKTMVSDQVAEFCGKVITKEQVIPQLKYRMVSDRSFVDIARNLGPQSVSLFRPRQREVLKEIAHVPEEIGGLGWNPKGIPLDERMKDPIALEFLSSYLETDQTLLYERSSLRVNRHHYLTRWLDTGRYVSIPNGISVEESSYRPGRLKSEVHNTILDTCQVSREMFEDSEDPGSAWSPAERKSSDPRGPTTLAKLSSKILKAKRSQGLER